MPKTLAGHPMTVVTPLEDRIPRGYVREPTGRGSRTSSQSDTSATNFGQENFGLLTVGVGRDRFMHLGGTTADILLIPMISCFEEG